MFLFKPNGEEKFVASSDSMLSELGIRLVTGRDFKRFKEIASQVRPDHTVQDPLNCDVADLDPKNAMWTIGYDAGGKVVFLQAMKVLQTGHGSVADYLGAHYADFLPERSTIDLSKTRYRPGPGAMRMRGRIVYSGEFWLDGEMAKLRGSRLSNVLSRYVYLLALNELNPDYFIAFMLHGLCAKGVSFRTGWHHTEPHALRWQMKDTAQQLEGSMLYMSRDDILFSLDLPVSETGAIAA
ncbi:MAG: hypothetical protein AAGM84_04715 [Pseudomonadota bacterium]